MNENILIDVEMVGETGKRRFTKWGIFTFSDENIVSAKYNDGVLSVIVESGAIWVSRDKGETWKQNE